MKYGEIFELTGKGRLADIKSRLSMEKLKNSENRAQLQGGAEIPDKDSVEKRERYLSSRIIQAALLRMKKEYPPGDALAAAKRARDASRMDDLKPHKPDDWLKLKTAGKI